MDFITRSGRVITFDLLNQAEIDKAKAMAPGEGVGPAIAAELIAKVRDGAITDAVQIPPEYSRLGYLIGLKGSSEEAPKRSGMSYIANQVPVTVRAKV
ncbi:MAG: hypothetical protein CVV05_01470 [Gammaproteobacteria bacterium HGW-Gammaproteobacteria-1]|jgi:hypothetical protein|nr:MAG: hypothetical protein CVV05_01470 [Gammaproteobacteria bacterium HGW-Gammaproteobacteria-1]